MVSWWCLGGILVDSPVVAGWSPGELAVVVIVLVIVVNVVVVVVFIELVVVVNYHCFGIYAGMVFI